MKKIIGLGEKFPDFSKKGVLSLKEQEPIKIVSSDNFVNDENKWHVMFWWPKDFSGVCHTELVGFDNSYDKFLTRNTYLLGASTDSEYVHHAWRKHTANLKYVKYPMIADTSKSLAQSLGILHEEEGVAYRAIFIINPDGIIKWVSIYDIAIGRDAKEVLRVLDALQTGGFCPYNWEKGGETL